MPTSRNLLLTTKEVAALLGLHPTTLRIARSKHSLNLPFVRIGGAIRYLLADVEAYLARNREGGWK